jgi:hypothetical protein
MLGCGAKERRRRRKGMMRMGEKAAISIGVTVGRVGSEIMLGFLTRMCVKTTGAHVLICRDTNTHTHKRHITN